MDIDKHTTKNLQPEVLNRLRGKPGMIPAIRKHGIDPNVVAHIVAVALVAKERHEKAVREHQAVKNEHVLAGRKFERGLASLRKKLVNTLGDAGGIDKHKMLKIAGLSEHLKTFTRKTIKTEQKERQVGPGKPSLKYFDRYVSAFRYVFAQQGKKPQARLIASVANLFGLTSEEQSAITIKMRIHRLTWDSTRRLKKPRT